MNFAKRRKKITTKSEDPENTQWHTLIPLVLAVYNNKNIHSATGKTPREASNNSNDIDVKASMELKAKQGRRFPELNVGDHVRILRKKNK